MANWIDVTEECEIVGRGEIFHGFVNVRHNAYYRVRKVPGYQIESWRQGQGVFYRWGFVVERYVNHEGGTQHEMESVSRGRV